MAYNVEEITNNFDFNVALGRHNGNIVQFHKFGKALSVDATEREIWTLSHPLTYPTVAETLYAVSADALDIGVIVHVEGVALDGTYQHVPITLNGTTPVPIPLTWYRVFRLHIANGLVNQGALYASTKATAGTPLAAEIRAHATAGSVTNNNAGASFMTHFTVPKGYVALIEDFNVSAPGNSDIEFYAYSRVGQGVFTPQDLISVTGNSVEKQFRYLLFPELSDFKITAIASASVNRVVPVTYDLILVRKDWYLEDKALIQGTYL